ncbi:MAG: hypothetical protein DHS80DRAFT_29076 [Piptocephalis tieghemiana]|nr:MAG: hypothetical protein DHS80DRAFT_29076 [Piptocephalis tieghemiana]
MNHRHSSSRSRSRKGIASLVKICQRTLIRHRTAIESIGVVRYELIEPILERCSARELLRLEGLNPGLSALDHDVWVLRLREKYRTATIPPGQHARDAYQAIEQRDKEQQDRLLSRVRQRQEAMQARSQDQVRSAIRSSQRPRMWHNPRK